MFFSPTQFMIVFILNPLQFLIMFGANCWLKLKLSLSNTIFLVLLPMIIFNLLTPLLLFLHWFGVSHLPYSHQMELGFSPQIFGGPLISHSLLHYSPSILEVVSFSSFCVSILLSSSLSSFTAIGTSTVLSFGFRCSAVFPLCSSSNPPPLY